MQVLAANCPKLDRVDIDKGSTSVGTVARWLRGGGCWGGGRHRTAGRRRAGEVEAGAGRLDGGAGQDVADKTGGDGAGAD